MTPGTNTGTFADALGSKINFTAEAGPGGGKALRLTSTLVQAGWCGVWHSLLVDLSKNGSLKFKARASTPGDAQLSLKDAYNLQYIARFTVPSKDWTDITLPLSAFRQDPYYTPPDAVPGHPMDLTRTTNLNIAPQAAGSWVLEIGPVEAAGTATPAGASPSPGGKTLEDWYFSPFQEPGTFTDALGSKINCDTEDGPGGLKAVKLTSTLAQGGWCGLGCSIPASDLSKNTSLRFKARAAAPVALQIGLLDANKAQYITTVAVTAKDWTEVTVPFSSFIKDPYYTPPGARLGHPMDLTRTTNLNFMPRTPGRSVVEIGPVEAAGTGGAFHETASFLKAEAKRKAAIRSQTPVVGISRSGGAPISPFAFGNCYFDWMDWSKNGTVGLKGTEEAVKALGLNVIVGANNFNDSNSPQLFNEAEEDKFIQYCRTVGAEPIMIVPVYGNNVDGGRMTAKIAADIVTYVNGTKKYGVKYWSIGDEVDLYDIFFRGGPGGSGKSLPVSTVSQYAAIYNSYARAMTAANAAAHSGVEMKFVGPELGAKFFSGGNDWLGPMLDQCKDFIDVVSIHAYGFSAHELSAEGALTDIDRFPQLIRDVKATIAKHGRPGTPLAITEANVCYDGTADLYTPEERKVGPGTFYAALWDADRMGAALEAGLWTFAFWDLAEPDLSGKGNLFGFVWTDSSKNPPACRLTPEYYAEQMVDRNLSGTTLQPSGVPEDLSVYASYDPKKAATAILVLNKDSVKRSLKLAVEGLPPRKIRFAPMSINLVTIPDGSAGYQELEYTMKMAEAGEPPRQAR